MAHVGFVVTPVVEQLMLKFLPPSLNRHVQSPPMSISPAGSSLDPDYHCNSLFLARQAPYGGHTQLALFCRGGR